MYYLLTIVYNQKIKEKLIRNDDKKKILQGIVEVLCVGDKIDENRSCLVQILSHWVLLLNHARNTLEQQEVLINNLGLKFSRT